MTWADMQDRLRRVIGIFQENIYKLSTGEEVIKFSKDMFLTVSQAFNIYATSVVMEENQDGPPVLIVNMIQRLENKLDELLLNCPFEPSPVSHETATQSAEDIVSRANQYFKDIEKTMAELHKRKGDTREN